MKVSLDPDQIQDLASKINRTVQGLENIDQILAETEKSRALAQQLNHSAEEASYVIHHNLGGIAYCCSSSSLNCLTAALLSLCHQLCRLLGEKNAGDSF